MLWEGATVSHKGRERERTIHHIEKDLVQIYGRSYSVKTVWNSIMAKRPIWSLYWGLILKLVPALYSFSIWSLYPSLDVKLVFFELSMKSSVK